MAQANEQPIPDLRALFEEINRAHFGGALPMPVLIWNSRLRTAAGRFIPGSVRLFQVRQPVIEVARYLCEEADPLALLRDTIGHECIHYWLWVRKRPYGHTPEFYVKMREMGVSRYNTVPKRRPPRYLYVCRGCQRQYPARRRLRDLACLRCCNEHAQGKYDPRFKLELLSR